MAPRATDVRGLLDGSDVGAYAVGRIRASYDTIEEFVGPCTGVRRDSALDVGCGPGLETFALSSLFDRVVGVDPDARAIASARRLAASAGLTGIDFRQGTVETVGERAAFSYVLCNVMSHHVASRRGLLARIRPLVAPEGWLVYAEETEGYPLLEIQNALEARNARALEERIRQVVNGFLGRPGLRFFVAGTAAAVLEPLGFHVTKTSAQSRQGVTYLERVWARVAADPHEGADAGPTDADYATIAPDLNEARGWFRDLVQGSGDQSVSRLRARAADSQNRFAPFLLVGAMALLVPGSTRTRRALPTKLLARARPGRAERVDWPAVDDLQAQLVELMSSARA